VHASIGVVALDDRLRHVRALLLPIDYRDSTKEKHPRHITSRLPRPSSFDNIEVFNDFESSKDGNPSRRAPTLLFIASRRF
jgi:hypothetical protein